MKTNLQKHLPIVIGIIIGILFLFLIYTFFNGDTNNNIVKYLGSDTKDSQNNSITNNNVAPKVIETTSDIAFTPRVIAGGGSDWVVSLLETQPKIFTGKVLYDNGLKNSEIALDENNNILTGVVKTLTGIENARLEMTIGNCTDTDGNVYEYNLNGSIGQTNLKGCGGKAIKVNSQE